MPRKSSIMAKIKDTVKELSGQVDQAIAEAAGYIEDAEKYRELKPVIARLTARTIEEPAANAPAITKPAADPVIKESTTSKPVSKKEAKARMKRAAEQAQADNDNPVNSQVPAET